MNNWSETSDEGADFHPFTLHKVTYYEARGNVALDRGDTKHAEEMYETALQETRFLLRAVDNLKNQGLAPHEEQTVEQVETNLRQMQNSLHGELEEL